MMDTLSGFKRITGSRLLNHSVRKRRRMSVQNVTEVNIRSPDLLLGQITFDISLVYATLFLHYVKYRWKLYDHFVLLSDDPHITAEV